MAAYDNDLKTRLKLFENEPDIFWKYVKEYVPTSEKIGQLIADYSVNFEISYNQFTDEDKKNIESTWKILLELRDQMDDRKLSDQHVFESLTKVINNLNGNDSKQLQLLYSSNHVSSLSKNLQKVIFYTSVLQQIKKETYDSITVDVSYNIMLRQFIAEIGRAHV